jgi:hypothetical protein
VVRKTAEDAANKKQAEFELMVQRMMKLMEEKKLEMDKKMRHEPDAEEAKKTKSFVNANSVLFTKHTPWLLKSEGTAFFFTQALFSSLVGHSLNFPKLAKPFRSR